MKYDNLNLMVEIEDYKSVESGKATIAEFTAYLPNEKMRIRKCKLLKLKNGNYKIVMPSYADKPFDQFGSNTNTTFKPYVEFDTEKQIELEMKLLTIIKETELLKENSPPDISFRR